jgi:HK97 family phage portal protein
MPLSSLAGRLSLSPGARRDIARVEDRTPVPLARSIGMGRGSLFGDRRGSAGFFAQLSTYGDDSVIHSIVARLAEETAAAEWALYSNAGNEQDRRPIKSHGVLDFLDHPNDFQSWAEIVESGQQHHDLVGELDIVLGFVGGVRQPIDCWLLRPDRIQPVPDPVEFLAGWIYVSPDGGERIPLSVREVMRTRQPSPVDPYRGMGAIQALMLDLAGQSASKEWQASFFENSARPSGVIEIDRHLVDQEYDEMQQRWADGHKGVSKAHRVALLEHGAKWVETSFNMRDLQVAELENVARDKALVAFGMPKSVLGIVEDVNRANAEAGEYLFAKHMIRPRLKRWKAMLNRQLLPLFGERAARQYVLDFEDPVPENDEAALNELKIKGEALVALVGAGFEPADVLEMLEWPDLGYEKPAPPPIKAAGSVPGQDQPAIEQAAADDTVTDVSRETIAFGWDDPSIDAAMRWKVVGHPDANCCDPCLANIGKLYRNRESAWSDYPAGRSYIKCVGEQYGNHCRCRVIKRREARS